MMAAAKKAKNLGCYTL